MKDKANTPFENLKIYTFSLCLSGSILFSSIELFGGKVIDLPETPLGFYEEKALSPAQRRLPRSHFLKMTPAKDQDPLGTCVSFAVSACGEYYYPSKRFSEAEFTILAETHLSPSEGGDCKPGLYLGKALNVAQTYGFIDESKLPYKNYIYYVAQKNNIKPNSSHWIERLRQKQEPDICRRDFIPRSLQGSIYSPRTSYNNTMTEMGYDLKLFGTTEDIGYRLPNTYPLHHVSKFSLSRATRYGRIENEEGSIGQPTHADIAAAKKALFKGYPIAAALPVFEECWDEDVIELPTKHNQYVGSHAVVLTGFDDNAQMFILKNSWGQEWGDNGFKPIPYEYVTTYSTELVAVGK